MVHETHLGLKTKQGTRTQYLLLYSLVLHLTLTPTAATLPTADTQNIFLNLFGSKSVAV